MKMRKFACALFSLAFLFSCSNSSSSSVEPEQFEPCSSDSSEPDPLLLECPPEDIALCPVQDKLPDDWRQNTPDGGCASELKISKEKLSFGPQGGVKCITTSHNNTGLSKSDEDCIGDGEQGWNGYKKIECSWFTVTKIGERVFHISVNKNETGSERNLNVHMIALYCGNHVSITQSSD